MTYTVILADDHRIFRDGLRPLLDRQPDFEVVAEAEDGLETLEMVWEHKPDILVLDISMPKLNGIEVTRRVVSEFPQCKIVILSMHADRRFVLETLKAGASGYLLKESSFKELLSALRAAVNGQIHLSEQISGTVIKEYLSIAKQSAGSAFSLLSAREREVLQMLAEGKSNKEIASQLNISVKTIETHRKNIMEKLNIHTVAELTKYAIREGITPLN